MKKIMVFVMCLALLMAVPVPAFAESTGSGMDLKVEDSIIKENFITRSTSITATHNQKFTSDGVTIAEIAITGTFHYAPNVVMVASKSVSKCNTYDGWTFQRSSFISSGGSIVLTGTLTKSGKSVGVHISLSCDTEGNIYY